MNSNLKRWILLGTLATLWGPSFLVIKIGLEAIPPVSLAAGRVSVAALLLYGMVRLSGAQMPRDLPFWRRFAVMGVVANVIPFSLLMIGETLAPSAIAAIFNGLAPLITAAVAHLVIPEERLTGRTLLGMVVGFGGVLLLFLPTAMEGLEGNDVLLGMLAFTGMSLGYGISVVYSRLKLRGRPRYVAPTAQLASASFFLIPIALLAEGDRLAWPGAEPLLALLWLAVVATALAYIVYYALLEIAGATFLSLVTFLLPPIGVLLGLIFLDEQIAWTSLVGCGLILSGVGFVRKGGG